MPSFPVDMSFDDRMRERLLAWRAELLSLAETGEASADIVELDQSKVGRLSRMDAMQSQAMAQAALVRRGATLKAIAAALRRIDDGEYGWCGECGEAIDRRRLEIDPTALLCIVCANRAEE